MDEKNLAQQQAMPTYYPTNAMLQEDEIDLLDIWKVLVERKKVILLLMFLGLISAVVYVLLAVPVFKAESFMLPPAEHNIPALNAQSSQSSQSVGVKTAYGLFKRNLKSRSLLRDFFDTNRVFSVIGSETSSDNFKSEVFQVFYGDMVKVTENKKNKDYLSFSISYSDPNIAAQWVNDYVKFVDGKTVEQLLKNVSSTVGSNIRDTKNLIQSKRKLAKQRRGDKIINLQEALKIARSMGLTKALLGAGKESLNDSVVIINGSRPLYARGAKALKAEIDVLSARKNDDAFIEGLRNYEEALEKLKAFSVDIKTIHSVTIDQKAYPPKQKIKSKGKLILALGTILGLMLGIFVAFFMNLLGKNKEAEE